MSGCASQLTVVACRVLWCYPETDLLVEIVRKLDAGLDVPVTCKIRLLPSIDDTIALCKALEAAGIVARLLIFAELWGCKDDHCIFRRS